MAQENVVVTVCLTAGGEVSVFGAGNLNDPANQLDAIDGRGCHTRKVLVDRIRPAAESAAAAARIRSASPSRKRQGQEARPS